MHRGRLRLRLWKDWVESVIKKERNVRLLKKVQRKNASGISFGAPSKESVHRHSSQMSQLNLELDLA